jgi:hypothetical protein
MKAESDCYLLFRLNEEEIVCTILSSLQYEQDRTVGITKNNISSSMAGVFHNLRRQSASTSQRILLHFR